MRTNESLVRTAIMKLQLSTIPFITRLTLSVKLHDFAHHAKHDCLCLFQALSPLTHLAHLTLRFQAGERLEPIQDYRLYRALLRNIYSAALTTLPRLRSISTLTDAEVLLSDIIKLFDELIPDSLIKQVKVRHLLLDLCDLGAVCVEIDESEGLAGEFGSIRHVRIFEGTPQAVRLCLLAGRTTRV